jgi:hypothetical protein
MLQNKSTTIVSEIKDFFTSSEKAVHTILNILSSLTLSEKRTGLESKKNNRVKNMNKLFLLILFPFFGIKDSWQYEHSTLYPVLQGGKDMFYRLLNDSFVNWRKISYKLNRQIIAKAQSSQESQGQDRNTHSTRCLIVDDTDIPKAGRRIEMIGKIFSHVTGKSILGFKGLFMGYHDGKSFYTLDFSFHGEKGKNEKKPFGLTRKQLKERYSKKRAKYSHTFQRKQEYSMSKINRMIEMVKTAIDEGIRFDYLLVDSWFTCYALVKFIKTRRIKANLIGMAKLGNTKYLFNEKKLTAKEIIDRLRKSKKVKRSRHLSCYYSEVLVHFNDVEVKLFFSKPSKKGKWSVLLTTDLNLKFEQAYKIYSTRWSIEVFFKEAKQYLGLGKNQAQDFDSQIASTTITMIQYNLLSLAKRFSGYETLGELFRNTRAETIELTVAEKIWKLIVEILSEIAQFFEVDTETLMQKLISDNERFIKLLNYSALLQTG